MREVDFKQAFLFLDYYSCYGIADGYCAETHSRDGTSPGCGRDFPIEERHKPQKLAAAY